MDTAFTSSGQKIPIAVLASGRGSNFQAIWQAVENQKLNAEIVALVTDQVEAPVLAWAQEKGVPSFCIPGPSLKKSMPHEEKHRLRGEHEQAILQRLKDEARVFPKFLVLAGYERILSEFLIDKWKTQWGYARIINIHPSLLPSFPGWDAYAQAFSYGCQVTGVTIHFVENGMDQGPICAQESFSIADCTRAEEVKERGLELEHRLYPSALNWLLQESFYLEERQQADKRDQRRLCVRPR